MIKNISIKKVSVLLFLVFMLMGSSTVLGHYVPDLDSDSSGMRTDKENLKSLLPQPAARIVIDTVSAGIVIDIRSAGIIKEPIR